MIQFFNELLVIYLSKTSTLNDLAMEEKGENGLRNILTFLCLTLKNGQT